MSIFKKVWKFLDGKKSVIMMLVGAAEIACNGHGCATPLNVLRTAAGAVGWNDVIPSVDPAQLVYWGGVTIALGHKVFKAATEKPEAAQ